MLKTLTIKNFQCWSLLEFDLTHPIVAIVGDTNAGKSAILRAFRWLCLNQPSGDAFIKKGASVAEVTVETDAGVVTRRKGKNVNEYVLNGQVFKAFGSDVPDEVRKFLRLSSLNFQQQMDPPFLFSETKGEATRILSRIVDLGLIDRTKKISQSHLRKSKARVDLLREQMAGLVRKKDETDWVPRAYKAWKAWNSLRKQRGSLLAEIDLQREILERASSHKALLKKEAQVKETTLLLQQRTGLSADLQDLKRLQRIKDRLEGFPEDLLKNLQEQVRQRLELSQQIALLKRMRICHEKEKQITLEMVELEKGLKKLRCPHCGRK